MKNVFKEIAIHSESDATVARRVAENYGVFFGFSKKRQAETALVASELAHNHIQHDTKEGKIRISGTEIGGADCLTIASLDKGPGMSDVNRALYGGSSCNGLGAGLKTVSSLSDQFSICSGTSGGSPCPTVAGCDYATIIASTLWSDRSLIPQLFDSEFKVSILNRPRGGVSGDGVIIQHDSRHVRITMVDSAGHGSPAAMITDLVREELDRLALFWSVDHVVRELENRMTGTRGLAVHCLLLNRVDATLQSAAVGNIGVRLDMDGRCVIPPRQNGLVGHLQWRKIHRHDYGPFCEIFGFMHTDGHQPLPEFDMSSVTHENNIPGPLRRCASSMKSVAPSIWTQLLFDPGTIQPDDTTLLVWQWTGK